MSSLRNGNTSYLDRHFLIRCIDCIEGRLTKEETEMHVNHMKALVKDQEMKIRTKPGNSTLSGNTKI